MKAVVDLHRIFFFCLILREGVSGGDLVLTPGPTATVTENEPLTLTCVYTANSVPDNTRFKWDKDGNTFVTPWYNGCTIFQPAPGYTDNCVKSADKFTFTMTTPAVTRSDHGQTWQCWVDFPSSTDLYSDTSTTVSVQVPISTVVLSPSGNTVAVIADRVKEFVCETDAGRPQASITWYRNTGGNDEVINGDTPTTPSGGAGLIKTRGTLQYTPIRAMAGWRIFCTASNAGATVTSQPATLDVQYPPTLNAIPDQRVIEGKPVSVTCTTESSNPGNPIPTIYKWTRSTSSSWSQFGAVFPISSVQKTDTATYTCTVSNTMVGGVAGSDTKYFILNVLYPPSVPTFSVGVTSVSGTVREVRGRDLPVNCTSSSNPAPTYTWTGPQSGTQQMLKLTGIQTANDGQYTCKVTNTMVPTSGSTESRSNQAVITVETLYPPSQPTFRYNDAAGSPISTDTPLSVVENDDFRVACVSSGNPPPGHQWTLRRTSGHIPTVTSGRILTVTNIGRNVNTAQCTATNTLSPTVGTGTAGTSNTNLTINVMYEPSKPTIRYSPSGSVVPSPLRVIQGQSISVSCSGSTSNPGSTYSWSGPKSSSGGSLTIQNVTKQDTGSYTCTATNSMVRTFGDTATGTNNDVMTVDVLYPPVVSQIEDKAIEENTQLSITCSTITPGNPAATFRWTRDKDSSWSRTGQTLTFTPSRDDADRYNCTASNVMQPSQGGSVPGTDSKSFNVVVYFKSSITKFEIKDHPETTINEKDNCTFECSATSNPASTITVMKDTKVVNTNVVAQSDNTQKAEYPIDNATCEDRGTYTCTAYNQYNRDVHATTDVIQLNVRCKPRPKYSTDNNITVYKAQFDSLTINLTIVAYPQPDTYTWFKLTGNNWTTLTTSGKVNITNEAVDSTPNITFMSTLNINSIDLADFGQYRLEIDNGIDNGSVQYFTVISQDKPQTPTEVEIIDGLISPSAATIRWTPMFNGGLTQTFHLQYRKTSDANWTERTVREDSLAVVNGKVNYTLTQLAATTQYTVRLFSRNAEGDSGTTTSIEFTTQADPTKDESSIVVPVVAGLAAGLLVIGIIVVVVIIVRKRRNKQTENPLYISADDVVTPPASGTPPDNTYAQVQKPQKPLITDGDTYAEVKKPKKTVAKSSSQDVYAEVKKPKKKDAKKKNNDLKMKKKEPFKDDNIYDNEGNQKGRQNQAYEDVTYENPAPPTAQSQPKRTKNDDGLIYLEMEFEKKPKGQKQKLVIHGLDDAVQYGEIDFNKKAEPLPDSDEEDQTDNKTNQ